MRLTRTLIYLALGTALSLPANAQSMAEQLKALQEQIAAMQKQIDQLNQAKDEIDARSDKAQKLEEDFVAETQATEVSDNYSTGTGTKKQAPEEEESASVIRPARDFTVKVGGFARMDLIADNRTMDDPEAFDVSKIRVGNDTPAQSTLSAKQSRFNFETLADTRVGTLKTFVEGDFFSSGGRFRLRHAFGEVGGFLAGQTWTTFLNLSAAPDVLDFNGVNGLPPARVPQLRYTRHFADQWEWRVALEKSNFDLSSAQTKEVVASTSNNLPDVVSSLRYNWGSGHVQVAGAYANIRVKFTDNPEYVPEALFGKTKTLNTSAFTLGTAQNFTDNTTGNLNVTYTHGASHYIRGLSGAGAIADFSGDNVQLLNSTGVVLGLSHNWSEHYSSTFALGYLKVDNILPKETLDIFDSSEYGSANIVWSPDRRISTGIEFLYGRREDLNGESGDVNRINFMAKYKFN